MNRKPKPPPLPRLAKRMRDQKQALCMGHTRAGSETYWLEPSQRRVSKAAALKAIACPLVRPQDAGLFGDSPQAYRFSE